MLTNEQAFLTPIQTQHLEFENNKAVVEASSLMFPPGQFPAEIIIPNVGNRQNFVPVTLLKDNGYRYKQKAGILTIDVLND